MAFLYFIIKYAIISIINIDNNVYDIKLNIFSGIIFDIFFNIGTTKYIKNKLDIPKNKNDLKQIYPFILPKFQISVL